MPDTAKPAPDHAARLSALRAELARRGLDGFVVPMADEHQSEYVAERSMRLAWLTGFSGSAGVAAARAAIFVDGRYTLQVRAQVPGGDYEWRHLVEEPHADWLAAAVGPGARIGYDPWLHTIQWVERTRKALEDKGALLVAVEGNPIDAVWKDQPPPPLGKVTPHPLEFAGVAAADKRADIAARLDKRGLDAAVLTSPESIAWLLNIRGQDVPCTPLPLSFAIARRDGAVDLFIDRAKLAPGLEAHLGNHVAVQPPDALGPALDGLAEDGRVVAVDPAAAPAWIFDRLQQAGGKVRRETDPTQLPKAVKNGVELAGARAAHARDGAAMARFLAWLSGAAGGGVTELEAQERLNAFRDGGERYAGPSFESISGAGPNGAIVHYRSTPETDRRLGKDELYLIDSGGQYLDGTTDVTRTVAIGTPTPEMRRRFTLVLKGHIALATARFPKGTTGSQLDTLARRPLWEEGLDYDHGTGHGVGSYLGVHEGPQRISKLPNTVALEPGMILSNEPGYYKTGAYGIRIENLIAVTAVAAPPGAERQMLGFETLTWVPIDLALVDPAVLTDAEAAWLDAYHARVREILAPQLAGPDLAWLEHATRPLAG